MFIPSCKILKISTWQDRQLRMCRNCDATLGTRFQVCLFQLYFLGRFFRPNDFLYVWKGDVLGGSVLVEEHYIIRFQINGSYGTKYSGMFSSSCRLILSQVHSSALCSEWRLMLFLHLGNKDCLNPGKSGCFLYVFWFIVCLKSLFELRENNLSHVCKRSQRSFTIIMFSIAVVDFRLLFIALYNYLHVNDS